ncbi:hypothetical protein KI387_026134, partial [Taxus chinensis]
MTDPRWRKQKGHLAAQQEDDDSDEETSEGAHYSWRMLEKVVKHVLHFLKGSMAFLTTPFYTYSTTNVIIKLEEATAVNKIEMYPPAYQYAPQITTGYPLPPQNPTAPPYAEQYVQQQQQQVYPQQGVGHPHSSSTHWSSGLRDCAQDFSNCCLTCWCPCITFGQIAEIVDEGSPPCAVSGGIYAVLLYFTGCAGYYSCFYRTKMRAKFNMPESRCGDCLLHCFCDPCAMCQEYRELKHKGYDPALGWMGNMQKQQLQGMGMAAPVGQTMKKSHYGSVMAKTQSAKFKIEKFDGSNNFELWK